MGIIVSIPHFEVTVSPLSITTPSTSYTLETPKTTVFGVATTTLDKYETENTFGVAVPSIQTEGAWPTEVTDVIWVHGPISSISRVIITTYLSTATLISRTYSTQLLTTTATVEASRCPTSTAAASNTFKSAVSTVIHPSNILGTATQSSSPTFLSEHGTPSISGQHRSVTFSYQGSSSTSISKLKGTLSSIAVSETETFKLSSLITSDPSKGSSGLSRMSRETSVTTVQTKHPAHATLTSRLGREILAIREPSVARNEGNDTVSSGRRLTAISYNASVTGTKTTSNILSATDLFFLTTSTEIENITTTTVYETTIEYQTTTIATTILPISCIASRKPSSTLNSSALCTSATPNPDPPENDTCAEDGLLEYSSTPQPPDTLEGCATACLADPSCLSFTFIPSKSTCYTSLYPLADSAFAGTQEYSIYNYDRGCYSCSS